MDERVAVARIDPSHPERFLSLRRALGVTSFGINQILLRPGERGRIHDHERQEEVYLVLEGTLSLEVEGEERPVEAGELAMVPADLRRRIQNRGPGNVLIIALGAAGEHLGRDARAYASWEDAEPRAPREVPLPADLPAPELRTT